MWQAVAFLEVFTGVFWDSVDRMPAEGCNGPGSLAALARARGQFDTSAFRTYLAGKLGLR
jgi:hypothetical protein